MIKRKKEPGNSGIVVAGRSKHEAQALFAAVAYAQEGSVAVFQDSDKRTFVTHASATEPYNPLTGQNDLTPYTGNMPFQALASVGDKVTVNYTICADGCGAHLLSESSDLEYCPQCSTQIPELSDSEIEALSSDEGETGAGTTDQPIVIVAAPTAEEARDSFAAACRGEDTVTLTSESGTFISHNSVHFNVDPVEGMDDLEQVESETPFQAEASDGKQVEAHLYLCSHSDTCGNVIVSTSSDVTVCPSCGGGLLDPQDSGCLHSLSAEMDKLEELFSVSSDDEDGDDEDADLDLDGDDEDLEGLELDEDEDEDGELESESSDEDDFDLDAELARLEAQASDGDEEDEDEEEEESDEDEDLDLDLDLDDLDADDEDEDGELESESSDDEDLDEDLDDDAYTGDEDEDGELESESSAGTHTGEPVDELDVDMLTAIAASTGGNLDAKLFAVANCGVIGGEITWTAFYDRTPVAVATASAVDGNAELKRIFSTPTFRDAVIATANADGIEQALTDYGFARINPDIDVQAVVEHAIMAKAEARVQETLQQVDAEREETKTRLMAALATASMGINRGVFKGKTNPTINRLIAALSAAGVGNAEQIVHTAFQDTGDQASQMVVEAAMNLLSQPLEVQNSYADMVAQASYQAAGHKDVEQRLSDWDVKKSNQQQSVQQEPQQLEAVASAKGKAGTGWGNLLAAAARKN
jgi:hypothetical protein